MPDEIDRESVEQEREWAMAELVHAFEHAAQAVEELSKSPGTTWGQVKAHLRAMGDVGDRSAYTTLRSALEEAEAERDRLREILRTIISRADNAKQLCANGYPVSAYNLASAILGQIGSDAATLRHDEGGE